MGIFLPFILVWILQKIELFTGNSYSGLCMEAFDVVRTDKRRYKRLQIELDLSCHKVDLTEGNFYVGHTVNVCPGGLFFETATDLLKPDDLLKVELSIPPTAGLLESGGKISGLAKILRASDIATLTFSKRYGVAVEFCQPPKLCP